MAEKTYILVKYDNQRPTHILREPCLPLGEMWQARGYLFVPFELANELGPPDDTIAIGPMEFPAWRMDGDMPSVSAEKFAH